MRYMHLIGTGASEKGGGGKEKKRKKGGGLFNKCGGRKGRGSRHNLFLLKVRKVESPPSSIYVDGRGEKKSSPSSRNRGAALRSSILSSPQERRTVFHATAAEGRKKKGEWTCPYFLHPISGEGGGERKEKERRRRGAFVQF